MKIGIFQYKIKWESKRINKSRIIKLLDVSDIRGVDWLIFPEMTLSGFTNNLKASTLTDDDVDFFTSIAKRYHINISFGGVENRYNKFITLDRTGKRIAEYSKIHLFHIAHEDRSYRRGRNTVTFNMEGFNVCPFICFDLRFPVDFWKVSPNVNLYTVIAAWPSTRISHWQTLLCARAIENQAYVIGVNSLGEDKSGNEYSGYSVCYSPSGDMVIDCQSREGVGIFDISPEYVDEFRKKFPVKIN